MPNAEQYQAAAAFLEAWFAEDAGRTLDDIRPYTPEGDAYHVFTTYQEEEQAPPSEVFRIDSAARLAWYIGKLADNESKIKRIEAQAAEMVAQLKGRSQGLEQRFGAQAEQFLRAHLTGKRRSIKTLHGTIGLRKVPARLGVENQADVIADLPGDLLEQVLEQKISTVTLNKVLKVVDGRALRVDTGEEVSLAGLSLKPESEKVYVKAGSENE